MRHVLALTLLALGVFAVFSPALSAGFVNWDDPEAIVDNAQIRRVSAEHLRWMFETCHTGPYQPLSWWTLALDGVGELGGAPTARRVHTTSIALHAVTAWALYFLARRVLREFARSSRGNAPSPLRIDLAALCAAALFALHPLRAESVAWATERRDVLYGLLTVLALIAWWRWAASERARAPRCARPREWAVGVALAVACVLAIVATTQRPTVEHQRFGFAPLGLAAGVAALAGLVFVCGRGASRWYALAVAAFLASLLAKGAGITLAAVLLVLDVWPLRRERAWSDLAFEKLPFATLGVVFGVLGMWGQAALPEAIASWSDHTLGERAVQAFYGLAFYPWRTLAPLQLLPIYELPGELRLTDARFAVAAVAAIAAVAVGVAVVALRRRSPAPFVASATFALLVAPMLGLAQVGPQLVADRYSYVPCMPFALLAAGALLLREARGAVRGGGVLACAFVAMFASQAYLQTRIWSDSETLWSHVLRANPQSAIANAGLGAELKRRAFAETDAARRASELERAAEHFERALASRAEAKFAANLSVIHQELARLDAAHSQEHSQRALELARSAVDLATRRGEPSADYRLALGSALLALERVDEALAELEVYVTERPEHSLGWANLGVALARKARWPQSVDALRRAVELAPLDRSSWWFLGESLEAAGDRDGAVEAYSRVLELAPDHFGAADKLRTLRRAAGAH